MLFSPLKCVLVLTLQCRDPSEAKLVENFLEEEGVEEQLKTRILNIIKRMGQ